MIIPVNSKISFKDNSDSNNTSRIGTVISAKGLMLIVQSGGKQFKIKRTDVEKVIES